MIPTYKKVNSEPTIMCQPKINFKMRKNIDDLVKFLQSNKLRLFGYFHKQTLNKVYLGAHNGKYHFKTGEFRTDKNQNRLDWELLLS